VRGKRVKLDGDGLYTRYINLVYVMLDLELISIDLGMSVESLIWVTYLRRERDTL